MEIFETGRLLLRPYRTEDFAAVHAYASDPENLTYMLWGPNTEEETRGFITQAIESARHSPVHKYEFAVVEKSSGELIGGGILSLTGSDNGEISYKVAG